MSILAISTFDTNTEGWTPYLDARQSWSSFGNPTGSLENVDIAGNDPHGFNAPSIFLGNQLAAFGGTLNADLYVNAVNPGEDSTIDIFLIGSNGLTIGADLNVPVAGIWNPRSVRLDASQNWRIGDLSGPVATNEQILSVLSNVTQLVIIGEYKENADIGYLDNVILSSGSSISINDVAITEGNSGIAQARFTVSLSNSSTFPHSVDYSTQDGTGITGARAGQDYLSVGGTLQFSPGQTSQTIIVPIVGDTTPELDETFFVNLRNPVGSALTRSQAIGTIINDDATPLSLSINDVTVTEGNSGNSNGQLLVTRSGNLTTSTQLRYTVLGGSASNRTDYTVSNGTINFLPRETVKPITFSIKGDAISEAQENFRVRISANNAVITKDIGNVTINDNDISQISINDISIREGNRGTTNAGMTISLSNPSQERITLDYRLIPQTARVNEDFRGIGGRITINPGQTRVPLNVPIIADTKKEPNETLGVQLTRVTSNVNSRIQRNQGTIRIIDDDTTPRVGFSTTNIRVREGNSGVNNLSIPVSLSNTSQETVLINYRTVNSSAIANQDYRPASGTLRFNNGETSKNITVGILGDLAVEPDETLRLELFSPRNATLGTSRANVTILNDDRPSRNLGNVRTNLTAPETQIIPMVSEFEGKDFGSLGIMG